MDIFKYYDHLGFHSPYTVTEEKEIRLYKTFGEAVNNFRAEKVLDISSLIEVVNNGFIYGDKSVVVGISKTPWMAQPADSHMKWDFFGLPQHKEEMVDQNTVASNLFKLLQEELMLYVGSHKKIGFLLTGGMDSRIVACVLNYLLTEGRLAPDVKVKAFTWGYSNSRDVVYAEKISRLFNWEWEHLVVDSTQMMENLQCTIENGSEFSPVHLHAMLQLRNRTEEVDCFIAGSFGDSVGRAEYSGTRLENLAPFSINRNRFSLIKHSLVDRYKTRSYEELNRYHEIFTQRRKYQQYELDYQLHYMRRMLNACMTLIDETIPLFQMFSTPKVFNYMWSLHPSVRTNEIYRIILQKNNTELLKIPWARTGLIYPNNKGVQDNYLKSNHDYGEMLRKDVLPLYKNVLINNGLNVFNKKAVQLLYNFCLNSPIKNSCSYEETLIWVISLIKTCERFNLVSPSEIVKDELNLNYLIKGTCKYLAKKVVKSF